MSHISFNKGLTLTELLVSIGIVMTIFSVITLKQSEYTEGVALQNLAADVGLSIREVQVYGISVKEFIPGSGEFVPGYGAKFDVTASGGRDAYILFADRNGNGVYDATWSCGAGTECLEKPTITLGNYISVLCYIESGGETCSGVGSVIITYRRPETSATFKFYSSGGSLMSVGGATGARIKFLSPSGLEKSVVVYGSGQVSIQ